MNPAAFTPDASAETASSSLSLGKAFARFCRQLDPNASELALATARSLAQRNLDGDTCLQLDALAGQPLASDDSDAPACIAPDTPTWKQQLDCAFIGRPGEHTPLILDGERLYLHRHWREETFIARRLQAMTRAVDYDTAMLAPRLDALFPATGPDDQGARGQKLAAAIALSRQLAMIIGGPGTGKTTTVSKILMLLLEQNPKLRILLAAPTGKAAARLSESIRQQGRKLSAGLALPQEAATLHRLLGWQPGGFVYDAGNPLPCDCLLIDEVSMVAQDMMAHTLAALPPHCRLILLGDANQLSSVEAGSVLGEITGRGQAPAMRPQRIEELTRLLGEAPGTTVSDRAPAIADCIASLRHSYRFAGGGGIGRLAEAVKQGDARCVLQLLGETNDEIEWIEADTQRPPEALIDAACERYRQVFAAQSAGAALQAFNRARILCAVNEGPWGSIAVLERLENAMREKQWIPRTQGASAAPTPMPCATPYKGQPIMIRRNDRETGLYNGDTGILWPDSEHDDDRLFAWFDIEGRLVPYSLHQLPEWQTAWTLSVHRSQGSEYDHVFLLLPNTVSRILSRELIYTGITRARKHCTLVSAGDSLLGAVRQHERRHSGLAERLGWGKGLGSL